MSSPINTPRKLFVRVILDGFGRNPVTQTPHAQHTTYPVPCLVIDEQRWALSCAGSIANVAPTTLQLMDLEKPAKMTTGSLLLKSFDHASRSPTLTLKGSAQSYQATNQV